MMAGVTDARRTARIRPALLGLLLGLFAVLAVAAPASAHAILVSTNPAQGTTVPQAPPQVVLSFSERVAPVAGKVHVIAPDNSRADAGDPRVSGDQVIIPLKPSGGHGTYLVSFRVISADSHPVGGAFTYSVVTTSTVPTEAGNSGATSPLVNVLFPIVRWTGYLGLLLLVGSVLVLALLWPQRLSRSGPISVIWLGAGLVAASTVAELALQVPNVAGSFGEIRGSDVREVFASQFGAAHLIRLGVLGAALVLLRPIVAGRGWGADRVLLAVLGTIGVATWSVGGHPSTTAAPTVTIVADMIHVASMSVWIGGLVMLIVFLLPRANATELGAIVPVWSQWATYAVGALVVTGTVQALVEIGSIGPLFTTTYGWLVLAKIGLLGAVLVVASFSRRLVGPISARVTGAAARLRAVVAAEAAGAAIIIGVTSVLVQTTPARTVPASNAVPSIQSAVLSDKLFTLTVDDSPAKTGINELHVFVTTPDGLPADVQEWRITAALPAEGIEPIDVAVLQITPDHAIGQVTLPTAGAWTFSFTVRTTEIDESTVTTVFAIAG